MLPFAIYCVNQHLIGVIGAGDLAPGIGDHTDHLLVEGIRHRDVHIHHACHLDDIACRARGLDGRLRRRRIRTHETTRPEQRSAEIACGHTAHILEPGTAQHLERRHPARTLRLPVIACTLGAVYQDERGHIVPSVVMPRPHSRLMRLSLIHRLDMHELGDEPALAVLELPRHLGAGTNREIRISHNPSQPGPHRQGPRANDIMQSRYCTETVWSCERTGLHPRAASARAEGPMGPSREPRTV
ncbi:Uncharacterised protein [Collinsella intestinalis]|nr:Uncharacterised protein [Collinsella intestinalis]